MVRAARIRPETILPEYLLLPLAALPFPDIDPIIVRLGPLAIHWYGVAYVVGILFGWWYARRLVGDAHFGPAASGRCGRRT